MLSKASLSVVIVFSSLFAAVAQVDTTKPVTVPGTVKSVSGDTVVVETAKGEMSLSVAANASVKKVSASNPNPREATPSSLTEIVAGDRIVLSALPTADGKFNPARTVLIISKSDIAARDKSHSDKWRTRGIAGVVEAVNPATNQITVKVSGPMGSSSSVVVTPKAEAKFLKYAPDSNKYSDAKPNSFAGIAVSDSIQALGDKSEDGTSLSAEEILTGSFQQVVGTVKSVDAATNEVVVTDLNSKKDVTISLAGASLMKRFPAEFAERMMQRPGGAPGAQPAPGATPPQGQPGAGRPAGAGPGGRGSLNEMIERFPTITVADLKAGEMIGVIAAKAEPDAKVKAFKMIAGVEPFVRMAEMQAAARGAQRGSQVQLQIPGLDGNSMP